MQVVDPARAHDPPVQGVHDDAPEEADIVSAGQLMQRPPDIEYLPAVQGVQDAEPEGDDVPPKQGVHAISPAVQ